jgi:hypothetical protein
MMNNMIQYVLFLLSQYHLRNRFAFGIYQLIIFKKDIV